MRNTLVVSQVALSVVLLTAAGLFLRSLRNASAIDTGFDSENILTAAVDPRVHGYSDKKTSEFLSQLRGRAAAIPGVNSVSFVDMLPLSMAATTGQVSVPGSNDTGARAQQAVLLHVSDGYFATMGMRLLRGRDFSTRAESSSVILNARVAEQLFPNQDPVGRTVQSGKARYTVIGVAPNSKIQFIGENPANCIYLQLGGSPMEAANYFGISVLVKTSHDARAFERPLRDAIAALDPNMAVFNVETMQQHVLKSLLLPRLSSIVFGIVSAVGLGLAAMGLFAAMNFWVRRRVHEIGIRLALGATANAVLRMVLREGLTMTAIGVSIGLSIVLVLGRFISKLLYGVEGTDWPTFATVSAALIATALLSTAVPAIRAARIEPNIALREE